MTAPVFRPRAVRDIEEIWAYTHDRWGVDQAERYVRMVRDTCAALARGDATGADASVVSPGYSRIRAGRHVVFFRALPNGPIEIVRILHERMDFPAHLRKR